MTDTDYDSLARAATDAVDGSLDEMKKVTVRLGRLTDFFKDTADAIQPRQSSHGDNDPRVRLCSEIHRFRVQVDNLVRRQWDAFQTFNVVLFGRTGVGKSTLISAMIRSSGAFVSQGESDWTTEVEPLDWRSCRLYDTPGINGWGRIERREDLETRARKAVEVADFVLVCFDSQSQQAGEFEKLAAWVHSYRKPVIAVLNVRNPWWRLPPRVPVGSARAQLSRSVREHAGNIRDELAKIGLTGVPVTALSLKRALFARAALPFEGPDGRSLLNQRKAFGAEMLERWSGYSTLEGFLVRAVCEHAVKLRIGALNDQLRGVIREIDQAIEILEHEAAQTAHTIEHESVAPLLRLLGYPRKDDAAPREPLRDDEGRDLLAALEQSRGGRFQGTVKGEYREFVEQRLNAELGALRARSLQSAEECVVGAFERREDMTAEVVRKASFAEGEVRDTAEAVIREAARFLERRAKLAIRDTQIDLKVRSAWNAATVEGKAGSGAKHSAWALRGGGILSGSAAAALGTAALANLWNPAGWTAAVAIGVMAVGSMFFQWWGRKRREKAERQRLEARREALAGVRQSVHKMYDEFTEVVLEHAHCHALSASGDALRGPVELALVHRTVQEYCSSLRENLASLSEDLPATDEPQSLLWEVATTIERDVHPKRPDAGVMHWLGEDWIDDPEGLKSAAGATGAGRTAAYDPTIFDRLFVSIRDIFDRIADDVAPDSGSTWLTTACERCADDADAVKALSELRSIADSGRPRIHLVGDYSAGKTSFIKRLLIDAGSPVPETLEVRADPTTDFPSEYDWDGITLIDNPGFQSGNSAHDHNALRALSDASAVLYLFQPNLIVGEDTYMTTVLRGSVERGVVPRREHTFFVVNRCDELGVDPADDPDAYRQLVQRKQSELSSALRSRNIAVKPDRVFCMASDPYGLVGNRTDVDASAFDAYRDWDGFRQFIEGFRRAKAELLRSGCDRSILAGGLARLTDLQAGRRSVVEKLAAQDAALARLQGQIEDSVAEGRRLGAKSRADLERLVAEHAAGFRDEVLDEQDPERLKLKADRFNEWWNDEALHVELEQWAGATAKALNAWQARSLEAIERRSKSAEFRAAFGDHHEVGPDLSAAENGRRSGFARVVGKSGQWLRGGATRNTVYRIGKALGVKFRPWGAVKLARQIGKAGAVLAVVGVALDVAELFIEERRYKKREQDRREIARFLQESVPRVVNTIALGEEDDPGILKHLEGVIGTLQDGAGEPKSRRAGIAAQMADARHKSTIYAELIADASRRLGNPWGAINGK